MARLIRAAHYTRLDSFEISGSNIGPFLDTFEQVARLLQAARRVPSKPITFFGLSSTGLGDFPLSPYHQGSGHLATDPRPRGTFRRGRHVLGDGVGASQCEWAAMGAGGCGLWERCLGP